MPVSPARSRGDGDGGQLRKDHAGKFRFHLKVPNGEIIAASQGYETKASAETQFGVDNQTRRKRSRSPTNWLRRWST